MIGAMERNIGGLLIYKQPDQYYALDCRVYPFQHWDVLPRTFNIWQNSGQLKIFFLARGRCL